MAESRISLENVLWQDAELLKISVGYDALEIDLRDGTGSVMRVSCHGYIGHEFIGFWDELVIERASVSGGGLFVERCLDSIRRRLGSDPSRSGSEARTKAEVLQITVTFIDGCELHVAASSARAAPLAS
jgi:hypothetical protein